MANRTRFQKVGFNWQTAMVAAGIAIIAPYFIRRLLPLLQGDAADVSPNDVRIATKDSVRDAADDLGVGGLTGTLKRGVGRITDRLTH